MGNIVSYKNGNYTVMLDLSNGSKMRFNNLDNITPDHAESIDVTISKYCEMGCKFCYAGCSKNGKHADIMSPSFIDNLPPYTELALNGNEPLHPDLVPLLEKCKKLKLVPSITVNQTTFMKNIDLLKKLSDDKMIYGLGVSLTNASDSFIKAVQQFPNAVIHVVNGIVNTGQLYVLSNKGLKILILGYKTVGRGVEYYGHNALRVEVNKCSLYNNLEDIVNENWFDVVSFDNLALEQLNVKRLMSEDEYQRFYCGDDGQYTFYADMVDKKFYKNSLMADGGHELLDDPKEMFDIIRNESK